MKMYIRICDCCGNTFETDKDKQTVCLFCHRKMLHDFWFLVQICARNSETENKQTKLKQLSLWNFLRLK